MSQGKASDLENSLFNECKDFFFIEMICKIIEKFNVSSRTFRLSVCINSVLMRNNSFKLKGKKMAPYLHETHNLSLLLANCAKQQFISTNSFDKV